MVLKVFRPLYPSRRLSPCAPLNDGGNMSLPNVHRLAREHQIRSDLCHHFRIIRGLNHGLLTWRETPGTTVSRDSTHHKSLCVLVTPLLNIAPFVVFPLTPSRFSTLTFCYSWNPPLGTDYLETYSRGLGVTSISLSLEVIVGFFFKVPFHEFQK